MRKDTWTGPGGFRAEGVRVIQGRILLQLLDLETVFAFLFEGGVHAMLQVSPPRVFCSDWASDVGRIIKC